MQDIEAFCSCVYMNLICTSCQIASCRLGISAVRIVFLDQALYHIEHLLQLLAVKDRNRRSLPQRRRFAWMLVMCIICFPIAGSNCDLSAESPHSHSSQASDDVIRACFIGWFLMTTSRDHQARHLHDRQGIHHRTSHPSTVCVTAFDASIVQAF